MKRNDYVRGAEEVLQSSSENTDVDAHPRVVALRQALDKAETQRNQLVELVKEAAAECANNLGSSDNQIEVIERYARIVEGILKNA